MKLAERREVVERSGLCTFCLRHAVELECYAKGGLTKPRCTRPGCDGEHTSKLHTLVGEADAEVNVVAGDGDETVSWYENERGYQMSSEYEDLWADTTEDQHPPEEEGKADQYECEYGSLWVGTIRVAEELDGSEGTTAERELAQESSPVQVGGEVAGSGGWDLETHQPDREAAEAEGTACGPPRRPLGGRRRPPHPAEAGKAKPEADPKVMLDRQWDEVRYNAWLRQLLSDDSSDGEEDEERYGRFAESGRWITELYGISCKSTPTLGRECSV
jgi:hypothetical protein